VERIALRQAGVTHAEDIELARNTAKKWKMDIDDHSASQNVKLEWEELHTLVNAAEKLPFLKEPKACALTTTQTQRALDLLKQAPLYLQVRK